MEFMRILSWNVNGLRATHKNGFLDWLYDDSPDILCLQETKAEEVDLVDELKNPDGYTGYFDHTKKRKGFNGVAIYTKIKPERVEKGFGVKKFDDEGRTLVAYFKDFVLINCYFPNSGMEERLPMKLEYNDAILEFMEGLRKKGHKVVMCGDLNVAHEEIDLARPKENEGRAGFREEERAWFDELMAAGYIDTFRHFYPDRRDAYSWWDMKSRARDRNVGWRIDYFITSPDVQKNLKSAFILDYVLGSDHCPVGIELDPVK
ncbi:exodeoxyribonuclease III [bacterium]|nr:exodeoxyribonuclease III [bacterium]